MQTQPLPEKLKGSFISLTTDRDRARNMLGNFLDRLSGPCAAALKALKLTKKRLLAAFDRARFISRSKMASGSALSDLTSRGPIRTKTGVGEFLNYIAGFLVHELVHTATRRGDFGIYRALTKGTNLSVPQAFKTITVRRKKKRVQKRVRDNAQTVSDFFNTNCL